MARGLKSFKEFKLNNWYHYGEGFSPFKVINIGNEFYTIQSDREPPRTIPSNEYSFHWLLNRTLEESFNSWLRGEKNEEKSIT